MAEQALTLTEFLLARIAEDEEVALSERARRTEEKWAHGYVPPANDFSIHGGADERYPEVSVGIERVLAECEAKRKLVEFADTVSEMDARIEGEWGTRGSVPWGEDQGVLLLRILALPHKDHPDYREEWRP